MFISFVSDVVAAWNTTNLTFARDCMHLGRFLAKFDLKAFVMSSNWIYLLDNPYISSGALVKP